MSLLRKIQRTKTKDKIKEKKGYNPSLLSLIQPQGGVSFHENYIKKGDGYEAIIYIYDYPGNVDVFWLESILNLSNINAITTVDVSTEERSKAITQVNKGIMEQNDRAHSEKNATSRIDAANTFHTLKDIYNEISQQGEVLKLMQIRISVSGRTIKDTEDNLKAVLENLEGNGFHMTVLLNEQEYEWNSLFSSYSSQQKLPNKRAGKALPAATLAASLPFNFSKLDDPNGSYLGTTTTGGIVLFDLFHLSKTRNYYNGVIVGTMGAGKSTALKKIGLDNILRGNYIRGFDVTGEFKPLIDLFGGRYISLDGSSGIINALQVLKTSADPDLTFLENEQQSFMKHLSKMNDFYKFIVPSATDQDLQEFSRMLKKLYNKFGLTPDMKEGITQLSNDRYPIFSDFLEFVREELYEDFEKKLFREEISPTRTKRLEDIELTLESIVEDYGRLFNGHSSIDDITNEQIVFFSIRSLVGMTKKVFNAQMFNALTLIWDNMIQVGKPQYDGLYEDNGLTMEEKMKKIKRMLVIIDESHRLINANNELAVDFTTDFAREARKYFGGLLFASQSIRDFVPEGSKADVVGKIKTLFELTQYKFIMKQDSNTQKDLKNIFQGQLSESELSRIPTLEKGQCILAITGQNNISMNIDVSPEELQLFKGGL
ncbi:type IV secretion system protein VirB4 [Bacillus velezensis]